MKGKSIRKKAVLLFLLAISSTFIRLHAEDTTPKPYGDEEFTEWQKNLRRSEIIAFGSMPFVTAYVTLGYGLIGWGIVNCMFHDTTSPWYLNSPLNPLDKTSSVLKSDQQFAILCSSAVISIGLGIADFIINQKKDKDKILKSQEKEREREKIIVTPYTPEEAGNLLREKSLSGQNQNEEGKTEQ